MSLMLDALHQRAPLPTWAPPPAQPLPRGPYPTLKWPEGCTHLPKPSDPTPDCIVSVKAIGAEWTVAVLMDGPHEAVHYQFGTLRALPKRALLDQVKLGGKWFDASEAAPNFIDDIQEALDAMEWNA